MTALQELLLMRGTHSSAELMQMLREGLPGDAGLSGVAKPFHELLRDYFRLDERASHSGFAAAFKKYPATARRLVDLCESGGLGELGRLMQSVSEQAARPQGDFRRSLESQIDAARLLKAAGDARAGGVDAFLSGFAAVVSASPDNEADMELSLAWGGLEDLLLDEAGRHAASLAFDWGPAVKADRERRRVAAATLAGRTAGELLADFFRDPAPQVLAGPTDDGRRKAGAPAPVQAIDVTHIAYEQPLAAGDIWRLEQLPAAAQLLAIYRQNNGCALFCTDPADSWTAGFQFVPSSQWDTASGELVAWLSSVDFQDEPESLPAWVRTAIPFGKIPYDASYWILVVDGPCAGAVLLSNEDVPTEHARYASFDEFVATLRCNPEQILCCGGYVSYEPGDAQGEPVYPCGYRGGQADAPAQP